MQDIKFNIGDRVKIIKDCTGFDVSPLGIEGIVTALDYNNLDEDDIWPIQVKTNVSLDPDSDLGTCHYWFAEDELERIEDVSAGG